MKYFEKLLPNQDANSNLYVDETPIEERIYTTILDVIPQQEDVVLESHSNFDISEMSASPAYRAFFSNLLHIKPYKMLLEIGTFMGSTTIFLGNEIGPDGKVVTIEKFSEFATIARQNIANNSKFNNITLINDDALPALENTLKDNQFDFIFLDGNKEKYNIYLPLLDKMLVPGGTIVVDDIFFHGDSLNTHPQTPKGEGVKQVLIDIKQYPHYHKSIIPHGNGCLILTKRH